MATEFSSERGNPSYPQCGNSSLSMRFDGSTLTLSGGKSYYSYPATSGRAGSYEPIPNGQYWIQPDQLWECNSIRKLNFWLNSTDCNSSGWGMYRITIHPYPGTDTNGRGGFFIHGGNHIGSAGCINLGLGVDNFVNDLRAELKSQTSCYIPLEVRLPISNTN